MLMKTLNPCVTGDTKVWTTNGDKTFSELAESNDDVMVYCFDADGNIKISKMLHPRLTGYNIQILRVTLDNGSEFNVTPQHMFLTRNGYVAAEDLVIGDEFVLVNQYMNLPTEVEDSIKIYTEYEGTKKGTVIKRCEVTGDEFECDWDEREICAKLEFGSELYIKNIEKLKESISESVGNYACHIVLSVKPVKKENVYNGTVAVYHNYFTIDKNESTIVNQLNCGE